MASRLFSGRVAAVSSGVPVASSALLQVPAACAALWRPPSCASRAAAVSPSDAAAPARPSCEPAGGGRFESTSGNPPAPTTPGRARSQARQPLASACCQMSGFSVTAPRLLPARFRARNFSRRAARALLRPMTTPRWVTRWSTTIGLSDAQGAPSTKPAPPRAEGPRWGSAAGTDAKARLGLDASATGHHPKPSARSNATTHEPMGSGVGDLTGNLPPAAG
mmetsp:Transcript_44531/g.129488  ORF Transcript_44531/g.129488 Transcript_44531/m.129488 type:complete len:221 (-) Transcript_44531:7-669(-)